MQAKPFSGGTRSAPVTKPGYKVPTYHGGPKERPASTSSQAKPFGGHGGAKSSGGGMPGAGQVGVSANSGHMSYPTTSSARTNKTSNSKSQRTTKYR